MALETSADAPAPLRRVSSLLGGYIGRLGAVWVEAEVAQLTRRSGLCFLTLRDLRATLSIAATCPAAVLDSAPAPVTEGARVVVHARPRFYEPNGSLSLHLTEIRPAGEGELLAQLERRKRLLAAEGLFDPRLKRPLPFLPRAVGLVTALGSAAERDVLENARRRWPSATFVVRHALMQGAGSVREVVGALVELDGHLEVDVIVVARGGGSVEDLLPFSDESLVRAVHACTTPVVSAIGHEPDSPILDLVADVRASTPTDAGKLVVPDVTAEARGVEELRARARRAVVGRVEREQHGLAALRERPALARPLTVLDAAADVVAGQRARARRALGHRLDRAADEIGHHRARLRALSPLATLGRGYAVARDGAGHVLASVHDVPEEFTVRLADGHVVARRLSLHPEEHHD